MKRTSADIPDLSFDAAWATARRDAQLARLRATLGAYLVQQWVDVPDPLCEFAFIDDVVVLEFDASGYVEIERARVPSVLRQEMGTPEHAWALALERSGGERALAIAAVLLAANHALPDGLHADSGRAFLWVLGMERFYA